MWVKLLANISQLNVSPVENLRPDLVGQEISDPPNCKLFQTILL